MEPLSDAFGRVADDLRVSVTDRCDFRCTYCMPAGGIEWLPREAILTFEEIARLVSVFGDLGVRTIRLTGGEPLVRRDLESLVGMLARMGIPDLSMTTNAFALAGRAEALARAGLRRVNISLDSLLRHRFAEMTRRDGLASVMEGIRAAERAGLDPIKINCVLIRGANDGEAADFARFARETGHEVRFIEYMPLDGDGGWTSEQVVPSREVVAALERAWPLEEVDRGPEPARVFRFADGVPGAVGVISSVTDPFCRSCDRIRLTADGQLRTCLFALEETDLRGPLRAGASDAEIARVVREAVARKWSGHRIGTEDFARPRRTMSMLGG